MSRVFLVTKLKISVSCLAGELVRDFETVGERDRPLDYNAGNFLLHRNL